MKLLGVLATAVALLLGAANVYAWLFNPEGELCLTDRWCGTTGDNGVCVKRAGQVFGACCTSTSAGACCESDIDCLGSESCGGGGIPNTCGSCDAESCAIGDQFHVIQFTTSLLPGSKPYASERLPFQLSALQGQGVDVICLTDVWDQDIRGLFEDYLGPLFPYIHRAPLAGGSMLFSKLPFVETGEHAFGWPASNRGITYAKVMKNNMSLHLFCSYLTTEEDVHYPRLAAACNARQSRDVLDYIQAKANGEIAIFLGNTGSGPFLASADAQWPKNFAKLQSKLVDTLLAKSTAACTYGCDENPLSPPDVGPRYVDHIMFSGQGPNGPVCPVNAQLIFTENFIPITGVAESVPLSDHYGVYADFCLAPD